MLYQTIDPQPGSNAVLTLPRPTKRMGVLYEGWFPELVKARERTDGVKWGIDLYAHLASIPDVLARLTPGSDCISLDIESSKLPYINTSWVHTCVLATLDRVRKLTELKVGLGDPIVRNPDGSAKSIFMPAEQDFINPFLYWSNLMTIEPVGTQTTLAYQLGGYAKMLVMCKATRRPIMTDIAVRDHWTGGREVLNPGVFRAAYNLAEAFGDVVLWDDPRSQAEADQAVRALG